MVRISWYTFSSYEDTDSSATELVYGTSLRRPGESFVPTAEHKQLDRADYLDRLRSAMSQFRLSPIALMENIQCLSIKT